MRIALRVVAGVDDCKSVELRDRAGSAVTVLTLQQFWIAPLGRAVSPQGGKRMFAGCVARSERITSGKTPANEPDDQSQVHMNIENEIMPIRESGAPKK